MPYSTLFVHYALQTKHNEYHIQRCLFPILSRQNVASVIFNSFCSLFSSDTKCNVSYSTPFSSLFSSDTKCNVSYSTPFSSYSLRTQNVTCVQLHFILILWVYRYPASYSTSLVLNPLQTQKVTCVIFNFTCSLSFPNTNGDLCHIQLHSFSILSKHLKVTCVVLNFIFFPIPYTRHVYKRIVPKPLWVSRFGLVVRR